MAQQALKEKRNLYVGGLDEDITVDMLRAAFIPFGDIVDVSIPLEAATGKSRGFGFVQFELAEDAQAALENMHNSESCGRRIVVNFARPLPPHGSTKGVWADADRWVQENSDIIKKEEHNPQNRKEDDGLQPVFSSPS